MNKVHKTKKICVFSGDITRSGGTEKVACQIVNGLSSTWNITIISLTESNTSLFFSLQDHITHSALFDNMPNGKRQFIQIVQRLRKYMKKNEIDILIDVDTILDMYSVLAVKGLKTKVVSWEHFNFYETMGNPLRVPIRKYITKYADRIVTLTKEDQKAYQEYFPHKKGINQIYNPVCIPNRGTIQYDITSNTIISVGRLAPQKGFDMLLEVAKIVFERHPNWQWIVLGEGDDHAILEQKRKALGLQQVHFAGRVDNVSEYLDRAALYVMTSRYEGFPLVLIEAKASHLPIVSFNCKTGPAEMVQDGINGYLVECNEICTMADRICELIEDKDKRQEFSSKALLDTEKMNESEILKEWNSVLAELVK